MANNLDVKLDLPNDAELDRMFNAVRALKYYQVGDATVKAGSKPILDRARQLAPRSTKADRDKRSENQQGEAEWDTPLRKTIKVVVRKYSANALAVVGPEWRKGNKAYFNTGPSGNKGHSWGYPGKAYQRKDGKLHVAGPAKPRVQIRNWIVQAFDETRPQQLAAMKEALRKKMREIWE